MVCGGCGAPLCRSAARHVATPPRLIPPTQVGQCQHDKVGLTLNGEPLVVARWPNIDPVRTRVRTLNAFSGSGGTLRLRGMVAFGGPISLQKVITVQVVDARAASRDRAKKVAP